MCREGRARSFLGGVQGLGCCMDRPVAGGGGRGALPTGPPQFKKLACF